MPQSTLVLAPGQLIGDRLRVERIIGAGGMGVVACARHLELQQDFAVKMLKPELANDARTVDRFLREARAVAGLRTEHVCRVFDVARTHEGVPYIVMEMLHGGDISELIKTRPLPPSMAVEYVLQASIALAEAHRLGIVHRDLKPANLFVVRRPDGGPLVKVLDFGIAKAADELRLTGTMTMLGSPPYMSPEQLMSPRDVDARSDIWSLGASLYQMLCGGFPFAGASVGEMAVSITTESPRPLDVEPGLSAVIMRCFEKDASRRWQDIASLATALAPYGGPSGPTLAAAVRSAAGGGTVDMQVPPPPPPSMQMPHAVPAMSSSYAQQPPPLMHGGWAPAPPSMSPGTITQAPMQVVTQPPAKRMPIWLPISIAIVVGAVIVGVLARGSDSDTKVAAANGSSGSAALAAATPTPPPSTPTFTPPAASVPAAGSDPWAAKADDPWTAKSATAPSPTPKAKGIGAATVDTDDTADDSADDDSATEAAQITPHAPTGGHDPSSSMPMPGMQITAAQRAEMEKSLKQVDDALQQYGSNPQVKENMSLAGASVACILHDTARAKRYLANVPDPQKKTSALGICRMYGVDVGS